MSEYWLKYFIDGFIEHIKEFNLRKAKNALGSAHTEIERMVERTLFLMRKPMNISWLFTGAQKRLEEF